MSIGNGAPAWPSVIVSNGRISRSEHTAGLVRVDHGLRLDEVVCLGHRLRDRRADLPLQRRDAAQTQIKLE